jgi:K+-transporting ATPase A subunit
VRASTKSALDTAGPTFAVFPVGVVLIVGALIYFLLLIPGQIGARIVG